MAEVSSARQLLEERADNDGEGWVRETTSPQDDDATIMARLATDLPEHAMAVAEVGLSTRSCALPKLTFHCFFLRRVGKLSLTLTLTMQR
jgi:hypothetical protein